MATQTASCRSSNGRSRGPAVANNVVDAPAAARSQETCRQGHVQISNISQAAEVHPYVRHSEDLTTRNENRSMAANTFIDALISAGPAPDRAESLKLYGQLIGRWTMDAVVHRDDGSRHQGTGEIHFGWVLEGRAIQDVWMLPGMFYGTTLQVSIRRSTPGTSFGATRCGNSMRARSVVRRAPTSAGRERCRPTYTLELYRDRAQLVSMDRRALTRRRKNVGASGRVSRSPRVR